MISFRLVRARISTTLSLHAQPNTILRGLRPGLDSNLSKSSSRYFTSSAPPTRQGIRPAGRSQQRDSKILRRQRRYSTRPPTSDPLDAPSSQLTATQRFRKLSREYGWSVMGVYLALTALDFPFCFAAVRWLGVERVGHAEKVIVENVKSMIPQGIKDKWREIRARGKQAVSRSTEHNEAANIQQDTPVAAVVDEYDHGFIQAEKENKSENASIWTQLALAYAIHKSFIFIRLPMTVAITPKVVKTLRSWGWDLGKRKLKNVKNP